MFSVAPVTPRLWWHDIYTVQHSKLSQTFIISSIVWLMTNFTNKDEIVKFLYLNHNQNTRVREHL